MTKLLQRALDAARRLPPKSQDEVARAMRHLGADEDREPVPAEDLPAEDLPAVLEGPAQAGRGQFASNAAVEAAFRRFDE